MPRITVTFQDDVWEYLENKAKKIGVAKSAVIQIAVGKMREQDEVMAFLAKVPPDKLKEAMEKLTDG